MKREYTYTQKLERKLPSGNEVWEIVFGTEIEDDIYFNTSLLEKLRVTKQLKEKYDFDVLVVKGASGGYYKKPNTKFMYAVRDNEELQQLILDSKPLFANTKEKLLEEVNACIYTIEHPEVRDYMGE